MLVSGRVYFFLWNNRWVFQQSAMMPWPPRPIYFWRSTFHTVWLELSLEKMDQNIPTRWFNSWPFYTPYLEVTYITFERVTFSPSQKGHTQNCQARVSLARLTGKSSIFPRSISYQCVFSFRKSERHKDLEKTTGEQRSKPCWHSIILIGS